MSVISMEFFVFCAATMVLYYILPKKTQWCLLLAASVAFYMFAGVQYIAYVIGSALVAYFATLMIDKNLKQQKLAVKDLERAQAKEVKKKMKSKRLRVLVIAMLLVLGELAFVKYTKFFFTNINSLLGIVSKDTMSFIDSIVVPLGCSYYTFIIIGYMVDVYRKKAQAQRNFAKLLLFVSYFPHITQGPISRYNDLSPQFFTPKKFDFEKVRDGIVLIAWGLFKKIVLSVRLSTIVTTTFGGEAYYSNSGVNLLFGAMVFSLQMYADFSGYVDIVRGVSEVFGITLAKNFERPNFAQTLPEFWRRWHISLSSWFREYVFYPLGASKMMLKLNKSTRAKLGEGAGRIVSVVIPVMAVWAATGFWHGSDWTYITWGCYHGVLIMLSIIFEQTIQKFNEKCGIKTDCFSWKLFCALRTFMICTIGRIFFNAPTIRAAGRIFYNIAFNFGSNFSLSAFGLDKGDWLVVAMGLLALLVVGAIQEKTPVRQKLNEQNLWFRWMILLALILSIVVLGEYGPLSAPQVFLYEQF